MSFAFEIGIIAGILFVVADGLVNLRVLTAASPRFQSRYFHGATGFVYTAISPFNPGLFIVETVWAVVALLGLWKIFTKKAPSQAR